jgi:hypothetical protein
MTITPPLTAVNPLPSSLLHGETIRLDIVTNGMIKIDSRGYVTYEKLLNETWMAKYHELQLSKRNQRNSVKLVASQTAK